MKLNPDDPDSQRLLANLMSEIGQVDDAVRILRDVSKKEPNNPIYELMLGSILTKYGRNDEAIKLFESLLKRYSDNEEVVKLRVRPSRSFMSTRVTMPKARPSSSSSSR